MLRTFDSNDEIYKEFKIILLREGTKVGKKLNELMEDYVKKHKDGNPQHLITNSMENEDFVGYPSMGIDIKNKRNYIKKFLKKNPKLSQELSFHLQEWIGEIKRI